MNAEDRIGRLETLVTDITEGWDDDTKAGLRRLIGQVLHDLRNTLSTTAIEIHLAKEGLACANEGLALGDQAVVREELVDLERSIQSLQQSGTEAIDLMARIGMVLNRV